MVSSIPWLSHKTSRVYELFAVGGWFDQEFGGDAAERLLTWRAALSIFVERKGALIVETGCQRHYRNWGDGSSTKIFTHLLRELDHGILHSVDISAENLAVAKTIAFRRKTADSVICPLADRVRFHLCDSVRFLRNFGQPIDFLYLDSLDFSPEEPQRSRSQGHQLQEITAAYDKLSSGAVVLLDDNDLPFGGKTRLTKQFLSERGWFCVLDLKQSLWIRSANF